MTKTDTLELMRQSLTASVDRAMANIKDFTASLQTESVPAIRTAFEFKGDSGIRNAAKLAAATYLLNRSAQVTDAAVLLAHARMGVQDGARFPSRSTNMSHNYFHQELTAAYAEFVADWEGK